MESQTGVSEIQKKDNLFVKLLRVETLGLIGFLAVGLSVSLPGFELDILPNLLVRLNFGATIGIILYLLCWPIAYYQVLFKKDFHGINELRLISVFFGIFILIFGYNLFFSTTVLGGILAVITASKWLILIKQNN